MGFIDSTGIPVRIEKYYRTVGKMQTRTGPARAREREESEFVKALCVMNEQHREDEVEGQERDDSREEQRRKDEAQHRADYLRRGKQLEEQRNSAVESQVRMMEMLKGLDSGQGKPRGNRLPVVAIEPLEVQGDEGNEIDRNVGTSDDDSDGASVERR
jgi:hypothetical protein